MVSLAAMGLVGLARLIPAEPAQRSALSLSETGQFEFSLRGRQISGPASVQVMQGSEVTIRLRSDRPEQLHLHGYELWQTVTPDQPASLHFNADRAGFFTLELHQSQLLLSNLEVYPQ